MRGLLAIGLALCLCGCFDAVNAALGINQSPKIRTVSYASQTGTAEGDSDFSADPPSQGDTDRAESFMQTTQALLAAEEALRYQSGQCDAKKQADDDAREACGAQIAREHCATGPGNTARKGECSECEKWQALVTCPNWPPLRTAGTP